MPDFSDQEAHEFALTPFEQLQITNSLDRLAEVRIDVAFIQTNIGRIVLAARHGDEAASALLTEFVATKNEILAALIGIDKPGA